MLIKILYIGLVIDHHYYAVVKGYIKALMWERSVHFFLISISTKSLDSPVYLHNLLYELASAQERFSPQLALLKSIHFVVCL